MLLSKARHTIEYQKAHKHAPDTPIDNALGLILLIVLYVIFLWADIMAIKEFRQLSKEGKFKEDKELRKQKLIPIIIVSIFLVLVTALLIFLFINC